jgi:hypothetical protein
MFLPMGIQLAGGLPGLWAERSLLQTPERDAGADPAEIGLYEN